MKAGVDETVTENAIFMSSVQPIEKFGSNFRRQLNDVKNIFATYFTKRRMTVISTHLHDSLIVFYLFKV